MPWQEGAADRPSVGGLCRLSCHHCGPNLYARYHQRRYIPAPGAPKPIPGRPPAPEAGPPTPPGFSMGRDSTPRPGSPTPAPGKTPAPEAGPPTPPTPTPGSRSRPGPAAPNPAPGATPAPDAGPPSPPGFGRARQTLPAASEKATPETARKASSWILFMAGAWEKTSCLAGGAAESSCPVHSFAVNHHLVLTGNPPICRVGSPTGG
jgi:hypothetical protein